MNDGNKHGPNDLGMAAGKRCSEFTVNFASQIGRIRPLNGGNNGPQCFGGTMDLSPWHRRLHIPSVRLHDCDWPGDYLVDIHAVFPDRNADPDNPASYDFMNTDDYIAKIVALGSQIVYRLGCRIEHTRRRRNTSPPADPRRWARICLGIIRHYNHGWANGHRWGIRWWEIWNEPDIPPGCWSGTWEDYFHLYAAAAPAIKNAFPEVQVGGPAYAIGIPHLVRGEEQTFARDFLAFCRNHSLPLDFFSWHTYAVAGDLTVWERRARTFRALLDEFGFTATESHLNEWNCISHAAGGQSLASESPMQDSAGASAVAASLVYFQDLPIDQAFIYTLDDSAYGLFSRGGRPQHNYRAMEAFAALLDTPRRCRADGGDTATGRAILAGLSEDSRRARILVSNYVHDPQVRFPLHLTGLPWAGPTAICLRYIDNEHELEESERQIFAPGTAVLDLGLPMATVAIIDLVPAAQDAVHGPRIEIDGLRPIRIHQVSLTVADGKPALAVTLVNCSPNDLPVTLATRYAPAWLKKAPAWRGMLPSGGEGRTTCVMPLEMGDPGDDRTLRMDLRSEVSILPIVAELPIMVSGRQCVLADWAACTPTFDAAGLHFHVRIIDDNVRSHLDDRVKKRGPCQGACVEFFFDWDRPGDLGQPDYNGDDVQFVCTPPGETGSMPQVHVLGSKTFRSESLDYIAERTPEGWNCDLTIAWNGIEAAGGRRGTAVSMSMAARAVAPDFSERHSAVWTGGNDNWCNTNGFGLLIP